MIRLAGFLLSRNFGHRAKSDNHRNYDGDNNGQTAERAKVNVLRGIVLAVCRAHEFDSTLMILVSRNSSHTSTTHKHDAKASGTLTSTPMSLGRFHPNSIIGDLYYWH